MNKLNQWFKKMHWLSTFYCIDNLYTKPPHFPIRGKNSKLSNRKRVLCWSIHEYIISLRSHETRLKGQCHEIFAPFLLKRFDLGPIWTGKNGFANFFVFAKIFPVLRSLSCDPCPVILVLRSVLQSVSCKAWPAIHVLGSVSFFVIWRRLRLLPFIWCEKGFSK